MGNPRKKQQIDWEGFAFPKQPKVALSSREYKRFALEIFERDNHTCRNPMCPSKIEPMPYPNSVLTVHHKQKKSHGRMDTHKNCITLCLYCHNLVEQHKLEVGEWGEN